MPNPTPRPVDPNEVRELALAVLHGDRFPVLATADGDQPRVRPITCTWTDGFTVYFANLKPTRVRFMREWALDYFEVPL